MGPDPFFLSPGPKGFFENPAYLIGLPFVILGALGALIALSPIELRWPERREWGAAQGEGGAIAWARLHPEVRAYLMVGLVLALATVVEVAVYYIDMARPAQLLILLLLTLLDFALVALWFMHLRSDSRVFSVMFVGGLLLAMALFVIVLATLGASLV